MVKGKASREKTSRGQAPYSRASIEGKKLGVFLKECFCGVIGGATKKRRAYQTPKGFSSKCKGEDGKKKE